MAKNIRISVFHMGARNHYTIPIALLTQRLLNHFYTDLYIDDRIGSLLKKKVFAPLSFIAGRNTPNLPRHLITSFPATSIGMLAFKRIFAGARADMRISINIKMVESFGRRVAAALHSDGSSVIYGFSFESKEVFQSNGDKLKIVDQYDCPSYYYDTFRQESRKWIDWEVPLDIHIQEARHERDIISWNLADKIFAPSEFVKSYLLSKGISGNKIIVNPYAHTNSVKDTPRRYNGQRKLRVLFVGAVNLMKGIPYLFQALNSLRTDKIEVRLIGPIHIKKDKINLYLHKYLFIGQVPRNSINEHYEWADILVLPSLCEGSANVIYEALSYGLPIICTFNSGAVITDKKEGFVVNSKDSIAIAEKIQNFLELPDLIYKMSKEAINTAKGYTVPAYARRLSNIIASIVPN